MAKKSASEWKYVVELDQVYGNDWVGWSKCTLRPCQTSGRKKNPLLANQ